MKNIESFSLTHFIEWLLAMPSWVIWVLIGVAALMLLFLIFSIPGLRKRFPTGSPFGKKLPKKDVVEKGAGMARAARHFHANLRSTFPGSRSQYRLPLYVVIGPSEAATQSFTRDSSLATPMGPPLSSGGLTWSGFDRGAVAEADPVVYLQPARWRRLIRVLSRFRPHRPLDGVILVLPADAFDPQAPNFEQTIREAELIRKALTELENRAGMAIPIYCVLGQCENIPGFNSLGRVLDRKALMGPLGFVSPYSGAQVYHSEFVNEAFDSIGDRLQTLAMHALTANTKIPDRDSFFLLTRNLRKLVPKLEEYLSVLLTPGQYSRLSNLRGIYVTGSINTGVDGSSRQTVFAHGALQDRIFPEFAIAAPTANYWSGANRNVQRARFTVAGLSILGVFWLWAQHNMLGERIPPLLAAVSAVEGDFRRINNAKKRPGAVQEIFQSDAASILQRLSGIDPSYLKTPIVPKSYYGETSLQVDLRNLQSAAYAELWVNNIGAILEKKALEVAQAPGGSRKFKVFSNRVNNYPNYGLLQDPLSKIHILIENLNHYENLRQGDQDPLALNALTSYLFDVDLPLHFFPAVDLTHVGSQTVVLPKVHRDKLAGRAQSMLLREADKFTSDLTNRDNLTFHLKTLISDLNNTESSYDINQSSFGRIQNLYDKLMYLDEVLESGKYDWIFDTKILLSEKFELLIKQIEENELLGARLAAELRMRFEQTRTDLQKIIKRAHIVNLEHLIQRTSGQTRLSPSAKNIIVELRTSGKVSQTGSTNLGFMKEQRADYSQNPLARSVPGDAFVKWDLDKLRHGAKELEQLIQLDTRAASSPGILLALQNVDKSQKINLIIQTLKQSFTKKNITSSVVRKFSQSSFDEWSTNFTASIGTLEIILAALEKNGALEIRNDLIQLIQSDALNLISKSRDLFLSNDFYTFDQNILNKWDGSSGLATDLLGRLDNLAILASLDQKRFQIEDIAGARLNAPLSFLIDNSTEFKVEGIQHIVFWRLILEDLVAFKDQVPFNNLARLEDYLVANMQTVSTANCSAGSAPGSFGGDSYFAQRLQEISSAIVEKCNEIQYGKARAAYRVFASEYNENFADKIPFAFSTNSVDITRTIEPNILINLIDTFDKGMDDGMGDPSFWPVGEGSEKIIAFLDKFDEAVNRIRSGIVADQSNVKMSYEITPTFRVKRDDEVGGNQIIDWSMMVGDELVRFTDEKKVLKWESGKEIKFEFRWAQNSLSKPVQDDKTKNMFLIGRDVTFIFKGPWSLFSLVAEHGGVNNKKSTYDLKFNIPIAVEAKGEEKPELPYKEAQIFVELLLTVNGKSVVLPDFPARAPKMSI